jgi:radical SAM superfamily enzyme YgiQ (UPF0313 family)
MNILLIHLRQDQGLRRILQNGEGIRCHKLGAATPLALQILAGLAPRDHKVKLIDDNFDPIDFDGDFDLVGLHAHDSLTAYRGREIYREFKKKGVPVVIGGRFIQTLPVEAALECADACVMSEGEYVWEQVLADVKNRRLKPVYQCDALVDLARKDLPLPRRDMVNSSRYKYVTIEVARGCAYNCDFCTASMLFKGAYRTYPIERVENDLKNALLNFDRKRNIIYLVDEDISMQREYKIELFERIKKYGVPWIALSNVAVGKDDKLLEVMRESGCKTLYIGFESCEGSNLKTVNKPPTHKVQEYKELIKKIRAHNIKICGLFIFGMDNDRKGIAKRTLGFVKETRMEYAAASVLTPIFNSRLYLSLEKEGRLISREWFKYWYKVVHQPMHMSPRQLQKEFNCFTGTFERRIFLGCAAKYFLKICRKITDARFL